MVEYIPLRCKYKTVYHEAIFFETHTNKKPKAYYCLCETNGDILCMLATYHKAYIFAFIHLDKLGLMLIICLSVW